MKFNLGIGFFGILALGQLSACYGQEELRTLKSKIDSVYNFKPHLLSEAEKQEKSIGLDKFWGLVKADTSLYLNNLRKELLLNGHTPFFYFDASGLLMELSKSSADKQIAADAISRCDINDISRQTYVWVLNSLAIEKIDITNAALKILDDTIFSFFIPQHSMTFNQGYCLTYCLLPLDPNNYIDKLISTFKQAKEASTQKSIITTIWFSNSCTGDTFLKSLNEKNSISTSVSDYAKRLLANTKIPKEAKEYFKAANQEDLIAIRESALTSFSDEAIEELDFVTKSWREKFKCR